jgi:hypothetical protein
MKLRIDPWDPSYGASVEIETELEDVAGLDLDVEVPRAWQPISAPEPEEGICCAFIDGVRRIDARLFAEDDDAEAPGLAGSWAVGAAWSTMPPCIRDVGVGREVVLGGGLAYGGLKVRIGNHRLQFSPRSVAGTGPLDPLRGLQNAMREAEADLAQETLEGGGVALVVCDGPLSYFAPGPTVGMIKRQSRSYLDHERAAVIAELKIAERTPIFRLGEQRLERYSWYLCLAGRRPIDGPMAGVVRLEVAAAGGLEGAQALAALAGACIPRFASEPGRDPRAPQNLYPVGALESQLHNRLGDATLIRRALEMQLLERLEVG